jgi:hypothetical protein
MKKVFLILFILTSILGSGQSIKYDTLNQDTRIPGVARIQNDTTIKVFPTADSFTYRNLIKEAQKRINNNNFTKPDNVGLTLLISKSGKLEKITISRGHEKDCIDEALRIIKSFKDWTPATFEYYLTPRYKGTSTFEAEVSMSFLLKMEK